MGLFSKFGRGSFIWFQKISIYVCIFFIDVCIYIYTFLKIEYCLKHMEIILYITLFVWAFLVDTWRSGSR